MRYVRIAERVRPWRTRRDQENEDLGQDLREQAIPALVEEHEVVCSILDGYPWRQTLARDSDQAYLRAVAGTADWLLGFHPGLPGSPCTKETPCLKCRFMAHARRLMSLFTMCVPADEALAMREDVSFIEALRVDRQDRRN